MDKRLRKSTDHMLAGVCGGIAEFFDVDPTLVRAGYALLTFFSFAFPGILVYLLLCVIMPKKDAA
ncbi:MAG: PspC domain-containing protein [Bacteroidaceae bacterium]